MVRSEREERLQWLAELLGSPEVSPDHPVASMDWDEVEALARTGLVHFGSHTHTHPILSRCSLEEQRHELARSRDVLRARGLSADLFAYPNGLATDFTPQTQGLLRELGYRCAVTMVPGLNRADTDPFALRRIGVGDGVSSRQFALRLAGL
jgi:peptidoglycan/xylan/chitin deacetylase (PgdA/CDA1 family)